MQFRIRNLLFLTFVAALCGGLISLSRPAGCLLLIPITIAVVRTTRRSRGIGNEQTPSLALTFVQSLALLLALTAVSLLWAAASICALLFATVRLMYRIGRTCVLLLRDVLLRIRVDSGLSIFGRSIVRCLSVVLAGIRTLTVEVALRLNRTNRTLYTHWSS